MMFFDSFFDFLHGKEVPHSFPKSCLVLLEQTQESHRAAMKMLTMNIEWIADPAATMSLVCTRCQEKMYQKCPDMSYLWPSDKVTDAFNNEAEGGSAVCVQRVTEKESFLSYLKLA